MAITIPFNRRTFRKFFNRLRPSRQAHPRPPPPPPPPPSRGRRLIDSIVIERFTMSPSTSAGDGLLDRDSTSPSNSVAVTSTDGSVVASPSGSLTASHSATSASLVIAYHPSGITNRDSNETPEPVRIALDGFKETGEVPKSPAEVNSSAPVHPVLHFNSLLEVAASPQLPMAAPPLQQPGSSMDQEEDSPVSGEAGAHESFPPLPLTPIHENSMAGEFEAVTRSYEVPGAVSVLESYFILGSVRKTFLLIQFQDRYPRGRFFRPVNGSVLGA